MKPWAWGGEGGNKYLAEAEVLSSLDILNDMAAVPDLQQNQHLRHVIYVAASHPLAEGCAAKVKGSGHHAAAGVML